MRISPITTNFEKGVCRVSAGVDGTPLWFESADAALNPSPEAFASAMLVPAIDRGERLTLEEPVSSVWRSSVRQALSVFNQWWGYPELLPEPVHHPPEAARASQTALLFSGGVDSFHTLLLPATVRLHIAALSGGSYFWSRRLLALRARRRARASRRDQLAIIAGRAACYDGWRQSLAPVAWRGHRLHAPPVRLCFQSQSALWQRVQTAVYRSSLWRQSRPAAHRCFHRY